MLIGLCGYKRSGKDTTADYLCGQLDFQRRALMGPLKEGLQKMFGFTYDQMYNDEKDIVDSRYGVTPREFMLFYGKLGRGALSEVIDSFSKRKNEHWLLLFEEWYKAQIEKDSMFKPIRGDSFAKVVVTDIRFPYEANFIRNLGGIIVRVFRKDQINKSNDDTETNVDNIVYDYKVINIFDENNPELAITEFNTRISSMMTLIANR